jgi:methionyl-tRNA formyltransferase
MVIEQREEFVPAAPERLSPSLKILYERHFHERSETEERHFGRHDQFPVDVPTCTIRREELNSDKVRNFLADIPARLLLSYGVHILQQETLAAANVHYRWNIHGGLSPWYRGCITHFWPSYLLEPQMTGFTIHELTNELDHGPVIHQSGTRLVRGDGLHDLACRAVKLLGEELPKLVDIAQSRDDLHGTPHNGTGRLWLARDWRAEHLRLIYEQFDNRIVDHCLDGEISGRLPELIRQW